LWPAAIITVAACVYAATAPGHVLGPDNPEFATLFRVGGVAHPSGYPLYVLYLRAMRWLPAATPAHGAALATALTATLALVLLYRACRALGASVAASSIVLAAHAFSARAWILATHAEVFSMNAALAAAIVWVAVSRELVGVRRVALLGLLAGLGLSNHHSIVLLAPIGLYGAARGVREAGRSAAALAAGLGALVVGLLPYAYLLHVGRAPNGHFVWGDVRTLSELWFHFRRGEYGSTTFAVQSQGADRADPLARGLAPPRRAVVRRPVQPHDRGARSDRRRAVPPAPASAHGDAHRSGARADRHSRAARDRRSGAAGRALRADRVRRRA
jgi:hypothetical protein